MKRFSLFVGALVLASGLILVGCTDKAPTGPTPGLGGKAVTKYVAVGNSLTAGYQSNALYQSAQMYSFPNLIAGQLKLSGANLGSFEQPLYSDPGSPDPATGKAARYEIISLTGPVIGPKGLTPGAPINTGLTRAYDNLGIPGAIIYDFLDTTNFAAKAVARKNPMFQLVLRSSAFGASQFQQMRALNPGLVTFWLGNNDVLGFATSGGTSPSAPTPAAQFSVLFAWALDSVHAALPNAIVLVGNIPDVRSLPFFTTVGPQIALNLKKLPFKVYVRYQKHGNVGPAVDSTDFTGANAPLVTLVASSYAPYIGVATGKWYRDHASLYPALPPGIDTTKLFGLDPRNPLPDALVLDGDEEATAGAAIDAFNTTISTVCAAENADVVDINGALSDITAHGYSVAGEEFDASYVTGGLFSLDGVHPSDRGAGVIANKFIEVLNTKHGMSIPYVDITTLPGIPAPLGKFAGRHISPIIPYSAFRDFDMLFGAGI